VVMDGGPIRSALAKTARPDRTRDAFVTDQSGGGELRPGKEHRDALRLVYQSVMYRIQREFEAVGDA
jgi:hypothetical protein